MGVPALLVDFPKPSSPEHAAAARHLGRQWPIFWKMGNSFFRPISSLGILGYAFASYATYASSGLSSSRDWRAYAVSAVCHLITVIHSALNMQPLNNNLDGLQDPKVSGSDLSLAEHYARKWIKYNTVRVVMPLVAGTMALWQSLRSQ